MIVAVIVVVVVAVVVIVVAVVVVIVIVIVIVIVCDRLMELLQREVYEDCNSRSALTNGSCPLPTRFTQQRKTQH